jgi:hypothetical protein
LYVDEEEEEKEGRRGSREPVVCVCDVAAYR